ncbi:MAG: hypothetical protein FWD57_11635 [Polyangiaceae bacterium]|nr:hypothetical protein [Polyangiaceae bacterium]
MRHTIVSIRGGELFAALQMCCRTHADFRAGGMAIAMAIGRGTDSGLLRGPANMQRGFAPGFATPRDGPDGDLCELVR